LFALSKPLTHGSFLGMDIPLATVDPAQYTAPAVIETLLIFVADNVENTAKPYQQAIENCLCLKPILLPLGGEDVKSLVETATVFLNKMGATSAGDVIDMYKVLVRMLSCLASAPMIAVAPLAISRERVVHLCNAIMSNVERLIEVRTSTLSESTTPHITPCMGCSWGQSLQRAFASTRQLPSSKLYACMHASTTTIVYYPPTPPANTSSS